MLVCPVGLYLYNYFQYRYKNIYIYSIYPFIPQSVLLRIYRFIINDYVNNHYWQIVEFDNYPNHFCIFFNGEHKEQEEEILKALLLEYKDI